jgi:hypothetical protein
MARRARPTQLPGATGRMSSGPRLATAPEVRHCRFKQARVDPLDKLQHDPVRIGDLEVK